jgi:hypothetical protein
MGTKLSGAVGESHIAGARKGAGRAGQIWDILHSYPTLKV